MKITSASEIERKEGMTLAEAQKFIKREGFAWTAVYVDSGDRFVTIGAKWKKTEYMMYFDTDNQKLIRITVFK